MRLIDAEFEENHYASMLLSPTPDVTEEDKHKARIIIAALRMAKTVEPEPSQVAKDIARIVENEQDMRILPKRGRWIKKHRHYGGFRSYTGFDAIGEQHTITVDERAEYDDLYCSECGARSADNFLNFCPNCGANMRGEQYE